MGKEEDFFEDYIKNKKEVKRIYHDHNYKAKFFLLGFDSNVEKIVLDEKHKIIKGEKIDLEKIYKSVNTHGVEAYEYFLEFSYTSNTKEGDYSQTAYRELERINFFFEVFYEGKIKINHFPLLCQIKKEGDYKSIGNYYDTKVYHGYRVKHYFDKVELEKLIEHWNKLNLIDETNNTTFRIARSRFSFSSLKYLDEDKLIDLMISFEALFLGVSEKGELSYKLALRVSKFLANEYNSIELFDFIKKAYSLRSSVVHGSNIKGNKIKFKGKAFMIDSVVSELTVIMRKTLRSYIQEFNDLKVSDFINHIDNTIISSFKKDM